MNFPSSQQLTFGNTTFTDWGSGDVYVAKINAATGAVEWVLQTRGQGNDAYSCSVILDPKSGDLYHIAMTSSLPSYFDPLLVDTNGGGADGFDVFIAKLKASDEKLPPCKLYAKKIAEGYCFVSNVLQGRHSIAQRVD